MLEVEGLECRVAGSTPHPDPECTCPWALYVASRSKLALDLRKIRVSSRVAQASPNRLLHGSEIVSSQAACLPENLISRVSLYIGKPLRAAHARSKLVELRTKWGQPRPRRRRALASEDIAHDVGKSLSHELLILGHELRLRHREAARSKRHTRDTGCLHLAHDAPRSSCDGCDHRLVRRDTFGAREGAERLLYCR